MLPVELAVPEVKVDEQTSVRWSAPGWCRPSELSVESVAGRSASALEVVPAVLAVAVLAVPAVVVLELVGGRCSVVALQAVAAARRRRS